jgi:hypothetical protein
MVPWVPVTPVELGPAVRGRNTFGNAVTVDEQRVYVRRCGRHDGWRGNVSDGTLKALVALRSRGLSLRIRARSMAGRDGGRRIVAPTLCATGVILMTATRSTLSSFARGQLRRMAYWGRG